MNRIQRTTALTATLATLLLPLVASAADLPSPESLFKRHIEAIGGRKAVLQSPDGTVKGTVDIVENGIKGSIVVATRNKDRAIVFAIPNVGEFKSGKVGDVVWSMDPMSGPRLVEGKERDDQNESYDPNYALRDASLITSSKTVALSDSEGRPCYRVEIVWKSGRNSADCYGVDDGLLLSTETTMTSPMGELKQVSHLHDYKLQGKVKVATQTTVKAAGMTQQVRLESFDMTAPSDEVMAAPAAIQALIQKAQTAGENKADVSH